MRLLRAIRLNEKGSDQKDESVQIGESVLENGLLQLEYQSLELGKENSVPNRKRTRVRKVGISVAPKKTKEQKIKKAFKDSEERQALKKRIRQSDGYRKKSTDMVDEDKMANRTVTPKNPTPEFKIRKVPANKKDRRLKELQRELRDRYKKLVL